MVRLKSVESNILPLGDIPAGTSVVIQGFTARGTGQVLGFDTNDAEMRNVRVFGCGDGGGLGIQLYPRETLAYIDQLPQSGQVETIDDTIRKSRFLDFFGL